jgi:hypothetical protein
MRILQFIEYFTGQFNVPGPPFNIVVIMDYDSSHAKAFIQNTIRRTGQIARCYHLASSKNDCIQCCDLLLGVSRFSENNPMCALNYPTLKDRYENGDKLKNSETRQLLAGYYAQMVDAYGIGI